MLLLNTLMTDDVNLLVPEFSDVDAADEFNHIKD